MQWLARICIQRPVFAAVLVLLILVLGGSAYTKLGLDYFPNVDLPVVVVSTVVPGSSAEEIESDVSDKIEGSINTISGIEELRSSSSEGISLVVVQFGLDKPVDVAAQEVRDKVSLVMSDLPKGIDPPVVSKIDPGATPVLYIALSSNALVGETTELADKVVKRQIESIDGVGEVVVVGGRKRQINVQIDPIRLRSLGITAFEVQNALAAQNLTAPTGKLETGPENVTLRLAGKVASVEEVGSIIVRYVAGRALRVSDVAEVEDGIAEEESAAQYDGKQTVVLMVKKQSGKNTVAVVDGVTARLDEVRKTLPPGASLDVVYDNSGVIRTSTHAVLEHLILGAILAALIVLIFLGNVKSTFISALAIPTSIVGTFAVMYLFGLTLNFLTLLALALAVGLVIDDAIVVIENIINYIEHRGFKPFPAALLATKDIGMAVLATTLALMAVFIPIAFMGGMVGKFLQSFGLTMASAIGVSLLISFTLTPMLGARMLDSHDPNAEPSFLHRVVDTVYKPIERAYMVLLRAALKRRWLVVALCVAAIATVGPVAGSLGGGFTPPNDKAQFQISLRAPEGRSVAETMLFAERAAKQVKTLPGVEHTLVTIGDDDSKTPNLAMIRVLLSEPGTRQLSQMHLMDRARTDILPLSPKELRVTVSEVPDIGGAGGSSASIQYSLTGPNLSELSKYAKKITEELRQHPSAVDVDNTLIEGKPELRVVVDRNRAADLGVRVSDVAATLQLFVGGVKASTYSEEGQEYEIRVRAEERFRTDEQSLSLLMVPSTIHGSVPLSSLVRLEQGRGPATIERLARARQITITANPGPGASEGDVGDALVEIANQIDLPPGYQLAPAGRSKEAAKMATAFGTAFLLSFIFMYLILAAQFESWLNPFLILLVIPLTVPFGFISLFIFQQGINMFSMLGLLVLFGVVQKNAVLQIDHTNQLLRSGVPRYEAILQANKDRLRPILMTTLAFVGGMIPLLVSSGVGAGFNQAMSGIVVGGQALSLVLTLVAIPVFYSLAHEGTDWLRARRTKKQTEGDRGKAEMARLLEDEAKGIPLPTHSH